MVSVSCSASLRPMVASHPQAGAVPVSPPSCPWRGSPGGDRLGWSGFHVPLPSAPRLPPTRRRGRFRFHRPPARGGEVLGVIGWGGLSFMFRFPPPHGCLPSTGGGGLCGGVDEEVGGCLPPAGGGGPGFTALLPLAGKSWGRSAGAAPVSHPASRHAHRQQGRSLPRRTEPRPSRANSPRTCPMTAVARTSTLREGGHDLRQRIVAQIGRPGGSRMRRYSRNTAKK